MTKPVAEIVAELQRNFAQNEYSKTAWVDRENVEALISELTRLSEENEKFKKRINDCENLRITGRLMTPKDIDQPDFDED